jgi:sulfur-oxidizing protein SoxY
MAVTRPIASRRQVLSGLAAVPLAFAFLPQLAEASASAVEAEIKKLFGDKAIGSGKIKLDAPQIAENGLVVPVTVEVESPMTDADYVKAIHVFADENPLPGVVSYRFTPASGKAVVSFRMRLARTQNVVCLAEMSNGTVLKTKSEVKVTIGGCGG